MVFTPIILTLRIWGFRETDLCPWLFAHPRHYARYNISWDLTEIKYREPRMLGLKCESQENTWSAHNAFPLKGHPDLLFFICAGSTFDFPLNWKGSTWFPLQWQPLIRWWEMENGSVSRETHFNKTKQETHFHVIMPNFINTLSKGWLLWKGSYDGYVLEETIPRILTWCLCRWFQGIYSDHLLITISVNFFSDPGQRFGLLHANSQLTFCCLLSQKTWA